MTDQLWTSIDQLCFIDTETKALPHTRGTADERGAPPAADRDRRRP